MESLSKWMIILSVIFSTLVLHIGVSSSSSVPKVAGQSVSPRPNPNDTVIFARWLVGQATWGVVSTLSVRLNGAPWGNVQSFADGFPGNGTGSPYFYLSLLDVTPNDILKDWRASFTISEETLGTCTNEDPEMPFCAKATLSGNLTELSAGESEATFAKAAIFAKHPTFKYLPADHDFHVYKLVLTDIWLVDDIGGAKIIAPSDYFLH